ncbi:MAG: hypothetical protein IJ730_00085 [Alphaproteobacteria bacterium]|nr:hypothetical protein [Alphaproteobacteria bacterium]
MKQYDFVVPIGESCIASFNLRRLGLQMCSYPFDWLMDFKLKSFSYYLNNNFLDFLPQKKSSSLFGYSSYELLALQRCGDKYIICALFS